MARRGRGRRKRFKHIYAGPDSYYNVVRDITGDGKFKSPAEVAAIALAQLADLYDGLTIDKKTGKVKPFSWRTWFGRTRILKRLAKLNRGKVDDVTVELVDQIARQVFELRKQGREREARQIILNFLTEVLGSSKARKLIQKVSNTR